MAAASEIKSGALVSLEELNSSSSDLRQHGASLRLTGKLQEYRLQEYSVDTAIAVIVDRNASVKIDTQHLNLNLRVGSIYQFIGEVVLQPDDEVILKARVGRNVDGIDLNLYHQSAKLVREFASNQMNSHLPPS